MPSDFFVGSFGNSFFSLEPPKIRNDGQLLGNIGDIGSPIEPVLKLFQKSIPEFGIAADRIEAAVGR